MSPTDRFCGFCGTVRQQSLSASGEVTLAEMPPSASANLLDLSAATATPGEAREPGRDEGVAKDEGASSGEPEISETRGEVTGDVSGSVAATDTTGGGALLFGGGAGESSAAAGTQAAREQAEEPEEVAGESTPAPDDPVALMRPAQFDTGEHFLPPPAAAEDARQRTTGGTAGKDLEAEGRARRYDSTGKLRSAAKQLEPETVLHGRYEIARRVGGGGMGAVYLAKDRNLGDAPRAVKEMIQSQLDEAQHEKAINDFKRESMLLSSLEHPSIPTIYDYFYDEGSNRFYLVMKYISGGDFLQRLKNAPNGRIDEKTVADWGMQVADVLDYLHRRNPPIIYRDLKPANLMIDGNSGRVMLIDFGIARWVTTQQEKGVTAVGTMGYAPPELFSGKVETRSDIYSLGATMFHLLTGSDPQDNPLLIFDFHKHPRPRQLAPSISNEMEAILMRTVEYKPENRLRSAGELRDALAAHLDKLRAGQITYGQTIAGTPGSANLRTLQVEMVYCGFCGGRIAADDVFCAHCGQRQPLAVASAALRTARATAKLVVMGTTELDSSFHLQKENSLVGRSDPHSNIFPEVDLSRFDPQTKISRRHARIYRKGDVYLIEDLGSVNGTVINDNLHLAPHQPRALDSGDKLRLGETTLHFLIG